MYDCTQTITLVISTKAEREAQGKGQQDAQPERWGKALIEEMHHRSPLDEQELYQQLALLIAFEGGLGPATAPPADRGPDGRTQVNRATHHDDR